MRRTYRFDPKTEQIVEVTPSEHRTRDHRFVRDIEPFVTQDGVEITSRSKLRAYEQANQVRQIGNDWVGPEKPAFWDAMVERAKARGRA